MLWLVFFSAWARTVAVMPFQQGVAGDEYEGLGHAIAGMLISDVSRAEGLELVERDRLQALLDELRLNRSEFIDEKTAVKLGRGAGAEWMVLGSWSVVDERFLLDARAVDVATGKVVTAVASSGTIADFVTVEKTLVEELLQGLKVELTAGTRRKILADAPTESFEAVVSYGAGLRLEARGEYQAARERFEAAARVDPEFVAPTQRLQRLRQQVEHQQADAAAARADARTQALLRVLAATPEEQTLHGHSNPGKIAEIRLRFYLLERLNRPCEVAEEMRHLLRRHGGELPVPEKGSNALIYAGHRLGMYPELPSAGPNGIMLVPRGEFENMRLDTPGSSAPSLLIGLTDGIERAPRLGQSLANLTIACAGPKPVEIEASLRELREFSSKLGLTDQLHYGVPVWVELELYELEAAVLDRGLTKKSERRLQKLLNLELGEHSHGVRSDVRKIIQKGERFARERALQGDLTLAKIRLILAAVLSPDGTVDTERPVCRALIGRPRSDLLTHWDEAVADGVLTLKERGGQRRNIMLAQALQLTGCVRGVEAVIPTHAAAVAYLDTLPKRQLSHSLECEEHLAELRHSLLSYREPSQSGEGAATATIVRSILNKSVAKGCTTL